MIAEQLAHTHKLAFTDSRAWSADEFATLLIQKTTLAVGNADLPEGKICHWRLQAGTSQRPFWMA